ncbi:MAG: PAS domain-containing protein [Haloarcula sp.]
MPSLEERAARSSVAPVRVLHVDDNLSFRELVKTFLQQEDDRFEVVSIGDPTDTIAKLSETDIDCVVSDYEMPNKSGIELLQCVREEFPSLPFVLFTGKGSEEIAGEAISAGVTDYLQKSGSSEQYTVLANRILNAVERYHAQHTARESERRLYQSYERITDGCFALNEDLEFVFINEAGAQQFDASADDLLGERFWDAFPELSGTSFETVLRSAMDTMESTSSEEYYESLDAWYTVTAYPDEDGLSVYFRDITERKQSEAQRKRLTERYERLVEVFPNGGVFLFNKDLQFTAAGGSELEASGLSEDVMVGRRPSEVFPPENAALLEQKYRATLAGEPQSFEDSWQNHHYRIQTQPIRNSDGKIISGMAVAQNITEQKEREQKLERQNERLESFASVVSHDLRSPLSVLEGSLYLAEETGDAEHFERAGNAVDRIRELVEGLLSLSRENEREFTTTSISLADCVENCWQTVETSGATLVADDELVFEANYVRLTQLLEALISNAVVHGSTDDAVEADADKREGPAVTVTVGSLDGEPGFFVADDGSGLSDDIGEAVFDMGYTTAEDRSGMGLAIGKQIAEEHGWEICVNESPDGGARFEISGVTVVE